MYLNFKNLLSIFNFCFDLDSSFLNAPLLVSRQMQPFAQKAHSNSLFSSSFPDTTSSLNTHTM